MTDWQEHLIIGPIVLPMVIAAAMLLFDERRRLLKGGLSLFAMAAILVMALALLHESATGAAGGGDTARVYQLGDWPAPFGIVLVADRLSTLMVALTSVLGACSMIFALARWDRAGPRFHALFLLLVMGVNGAFLTGDLFNLFVFFEIMLAASYGLALHGSGEARIRAGLAYIAVNLTASMLFLIGVSLIYGVTGTLNMADLAVRIPQIAAADRGLFHVGAAVLGVAFLTKCAMWPLGFWLTTTYSAASAPAAAVFAILSKVGAYVIIRLSFLLFAPDSGDSAGFGQLWILLGGLATIGFGTAGMIAARDLSIAAAYAVIVSSGTVLAAVGTGNADVLGGAVFYLVGSTLACGALFMLAEVLNRGQDLGARSGRAVFDDEYFDPFDDEERNEPGLVIPAAVAALGGAFLISTLMIAGLPPLAGFIGKLAMMEALSGLGGWAGYGVIAALSLASLGALIGLTRLGMAALWARDDDAEPAIVVGAAEGVAIAGLLAACLFLAVFGEAGFTYADHTADWLVRPDAYIRAVLGGGA
ncbi:MULTISPECIES: monovalent cation/H+ antiporter subunit D [Brevundimonas]|jgi:multicomponent K+:H+ antiporter subunit D|uniref:monovalent cation/H+ antiporter subunit D n=1 Tax=Brevundimonas TaxID=41275 RepID=UPI000E674BBB|nr:monovalent cation/H+ antiporter subunit D [Brevundimonas sp. LPMIX5]RIJ67159.1 monovalent cation/H+ antiporter subunit D [Brevundimonas sp. LPMIX5]